MEKASKYDFQALKRSFPSMSIIQIELKANGTSVEKNVRQIVHGEITKK